jgi:class 3 adenylate cyclase/tetratricopeptide (TPR) repeat protein
MRFCGGCGKELEIINGAGPEAERRHVFVLFCDLVGSTPLSHRLDAEDLRDLVNSYQRSCEAVVRRHDGFVAQYRGDSIEVYFGYPRAHEDDASRVVRCALAMLEAVAQLASTTKQDIRVRIGVDCGHVVVGALGSQHLAVGETPNIAARIQAEAAPGEVAVSDSLWELLPSTIAVEPMGTRRLKGVERPVKLFKVVASGGQAAGPNKPRTPFVGRARERERVRDIWSRAKSGVPQFAFLRGEPGIGKSRLVELIRDDIRDDRADVLVARCTPVTADTALHPLIELMGLRLGLERASPEERATRIAERMTALGFDSKEAVPLLASILSVPIDPTRWPAPKLSPQRARQRTMDILIEAFHALGRQGPVLFVLEDLHWADPSTIELMGQLILSELNSRHMALLTARPEFKPTWAAATNVTEIELEPLHSQEAETFIRKAARDKPLPPDVVWQIRERAAGNPLFLEEITRAVTESGALIERDDAWEVVGTWSPELVPASMQASLMARIDRLGEVRPLFQLAAAVGREFSLDLLASASQLSADEVRRQLEVMLQSGLVYQHGDTSPIYTFKHALVRDAAYDSLLRATRQRYHARIAEVLVASFPELGQTRPELLAHHLSGAGFHADAAAHWQAAGENAAKRSAVHEAVAHLRRALVTLEQLPEDATRSDRELSVLISLAPMLMAAHGWAAPQVGETCRRAIDLGRRLGAGNRIFPVLRGLWTNQFVGGRLRDAMETAEQVLAMGLASGDPILVSIGRDATSYTHFYRGEYEEAIAEAQIGLQHCSFDMDFHIARSFHISAVSSMLITKASALWMQGQQGDGIAIVNDMVAHARSIRHPGSIATALATAMFFSLYDRDWKRLFAFADEVYDLSRAEGFAMWTANAGLHRGRARIGLGQVDAGVAEVLEWGALFRQTGSGVIEGSTTSMVSEAMHMAGRSEEALVVSAEGERRAQAGLVGVMLPEIFRTRGDILLELERLDEADHAYRRAVACARGQGARSLELRALTSLLDLHLKRGQPGDLPAELRRAMDAMLCSPDRPDLVKARCLLARICN